jgi:plastocyanin
MRKGIIMKKISVLLVLGMMLFISACKNSSGNNGSNPPLPPVVTQTSFSVDITAMAFNPTSITVPVNTLVVWTNRDQIVHTVTSTSGPLVFDSGNLNPGGVFSVDFMSVGTYNYKCLIHGFTGQVIVQ